LISSCLQAYYCSEACAHDDWKIHRHDCKHKGKTPPPLGNAASSASESSLDTPASSQGPGRVAPPPKRNFRDDGTVKIYDAHKPDPGIYRGEQPGILQLDPHISLSVMPVLEPLRHSLVSLPLVQSGGVCS